MIVDVHKRPIRKGSVVKHKVPDVVVMKFDDGAIETIARIRLTTIKVEMPM